MQTVWIATFVEYLNASRSPFNKIYKLSFTYSLQTFMHLIQHGETHQSDAVKIYGNEIECRLKLKFKLSKK